MTIEDRRIREREARRRLIAETARAIAEREGWAAVTTRRLSTEIEYSQPVIYKHFASLDDITDAVALEGFDELAQALRQARTAASPDGAAHAVAHRYAAFAADAPALYDAMFSRTTRLPFGAEPPSALTAAFDEMCAAVAGTGTGAGTDTGTGTGSGSGTETDTGTGSETNTGTDSGRTTTSDAPELVAETLWAALHGLVVLDRGHRLRPEHQSERIDLLVDRLVQHRA
jgi:AcrR family transcriptional regulator